MPLAIAGSKAGSQFQDGPAFSAYQSGAQALTGTFSKIQFQTENFDLSNAFDNATNYRFTPQVAGYYQVNAVVQVVAAAAVLTPILYKNGAAACYGITASTTNPIALLSTLIFMNGSTDYIEIFAATTVNGNTSATASTVNFSASLARAT